MECQDITRKLQINKDQSIGEVIIIVEGEDEEFRLLKHIFTNILDYNYVSIRRGKKSQDVFISKSNMNSKVIVVNTANSSIKSIFEGENYYDNIYNLLSPRLGRSLKNIPIYILWDRDNESNEQKVVKKALESFASAMDNEYEMNGLLLLSYPCVEVYELSNFQKQLWRGSFYQSNDAKKAKAEFFHRIKKNIRDIDENSLILAAENMHRTMKLFGITSYDPSNFKRENCIIFREEEDNYKYSKRFRALSLISIMLIDLGIIYRKDSDNVNN